jgi:hypothetical protein
MCRRPNWATGREDNCQKSRASHSGQRPSWDAYWPWQWPTRMDDEAEDQAHEERQAFNCHEKGAAKKERKNMVQTRLRVYVKRSLDPMAKVRLQGVRLAARSPPLVLANTLARWTIFGSSKSDEISHKPLPLPLSHSRPFAALLSSPIQLTFVPPSISSP